MMVSSYDVLATLSEAGTGTYKSLAVIIVRSREASPVNRKRASSPLAGIYTSILIHGASEITHTLRDISKNTPL